MLILEPELLRRMIDKYGEDEQLRQAMGECGELIAACQNYHRATKYGHREETIADVIEEAVDVYFMVQQIRHIAPLLFDEFCNLKLEKVMTKLTYEE
jgi:hypothetical protein